MDIIAFLNGDLVFPLLALLVLVMYFVNRLNNRSKYKR